MYDPHKDDWNKDLVPRNFAKNLFVDYRKYFEDGGNLVNGREDPSYNAFLYFADRILPCINAEITKYQGERRCVVPMSKAFSVSDEAFALLMVENYADMWINRAERKKNEHEGGGAHQERSEIKGAVYTCSRKGYIHAGWNDDGIRRFNEIAMMIEELRNDKVGNENLDNALMNHWKGMQRDKSKSSGSKQKRATATRPYLDKIQL